MNENDRREFEALHTELSALRVDVEALSSSVRDMVKVWEAAGTMVRVIKWLGGVGTAIGVLWVLIREGRLHA